MQHAHLMSVDLSLLRLLSTSTLTSTSAFRYRSDTADSEGRLGRCLPYLKVRPRRKLCSTVAEITLLRP